MTMVHYLSADDILRIHYELVKLFESEGDPITPPGPRDKNLVPSAAGRPRTALGRVEKYTTIDAKAAALFHSLVTSHPFHNGNKRTALVSLLVFLDQNARRIEVTDDELFAFVLAVANNRLYRD
jgi:death-on-curing family protein